MVGEIVALGVLVTLEARMGFNVRGETRNITKTSRKGKKFISKIDSTPKILKSTIQTFFYNILKAVKYSIIII